MSELTLEEANKINLIKWPELLVKGRSVTQEQAGEILVRTSLLQGCNDAAWTREVRSAIADACGAAVAEDSFGTSWGVIKETLGILDLSYLHNDQVASSFIGGPHGWCSWFGVIQDYGHNIGKWPSVACVYGDWCAIAKAFPFLNLRAQLVNMEASCEPEPLDHEIVDYDDPKFPVIEFRVSRGEVTTWEPEEKLIDLKIDAVQQVLLRMSNPMAERGCAIEQLVVALKRVANREVPLREYLDRAAVKTMRIAKGWRV